MDITQVNIPTILKHSVNNALSISSILQFPLYHYSPIPSCLLWQYNSCVLCNDIKWVEQGKELAEARGKDSKEGNSNVSVFQSDLFFSNPVPFVNTKFLPMIPFSKSKFFFRF